MPKHTILIVDDEKDLRFTVGRFMKSKGYDVVEAGTAREARHVFESARPDIAVIDYALPDENALVLLPQLKALAPDVPLVLLTAHGSIDLAVRAVKEGAEQFLTKPIELPALLVILERLIESQRNRRNRMAGQSHRNRNSIDPFVGTSAPIRRLAEQAGKVCASESPVLVQGETGTGKSVLARWLHENGPRGEEAFVDLNCAGLEREFFETELFGHEKGAFTGAVAAKPGLLEVAHRGTLFLDEIGDVALPVQPKLLKVLEEQRYRRLGDVRDRHVDVRLIAATHQDLGLLARDHRFRDDLYFRISTIPLTVPPLRERAEDIPILATIFLDEFAAELGRRTAALEPGALEALLTYDWPGNIRELRNVLERAVLLSEGDRLCRRDLRFDSAIGSDTAEVDTSMTLQEHERWYIEQVLAEEQGRVERAAARLGLVRSALYKKIKKHGITIPKPGNGR